MPISKHLEFNFVRNSESGKTKIWTVFNTTTYEHIGNIRWAGNFRKYAFYPNNDTMYDSNCLQDISEFLEKATKEHHADK